MGNLVGAVPARGGGTGSTAGVLKAYRTPRLRTYGRIEDLTAGGSGPMAEFVFMVAMNRHP